MNQTDRHQTTQVVERARRVLEMCGLKAESPDTWTKGAAGTLITVVFTEGPQPWVRGIWTAGRAVDVTFFDLDGSNGYTANPVEDLFLWLNHYAHGNRLTTEGTIGFVAAPA